MALEVLKQNNYLLILMTKRERGHSAKLKNKVDLTYLEMEVEVLK